MMRKLFKSLSLTILFLICAYFVNAGENLKKIGQFVVTSLDTTSVQTLYLEPDETNRKIFDEKLDDLANSWYINNIFLPGSPKDDFTLHTQIMLSDSTIISRLKKVEAVVKLSYNPIVRDYIEMYTTRKPYQVEMMLGLTAFYFPVFEEIFDRYELPFELKYLAIIESALNPRAKSRAGAIGLWQFMYGTAKNLDLEISTFVDERRDIYKSTEAAARYLRQLYNVYQDWHLVIAAYNCGPGNVNKAISRAGGKTDYWQIYYALTEETRSFVPAFIAATYIMNYYREHQLTPLMPSISLNTDTVVVNSFLNLKQISDNLNINLDEIRDLNPDYRRDIIPGTAEKGYPLRIPVEMVSSFIEKSDTIFNHERNILFPDNTLVSPQAIAANSRNEYSYDGKARIIYTVKSGDNPGYIANRFAVTVAELKKWNKISRNIIRPGQRLTIYVPEDRADHYKKTNNLSHSTKQALSVKPVTSDSVKTATRENSEMVADNLMVEYEYYTVRRGDNLWTIARKYPESPIRILCSSITSPMPEACRLAKN